MKVVHVKQTKKWRDAFRDRGGIFVRLPLDAETRQLVDRLHEMYGTETLMDLIKIGLNMMENQVRQAPPDEFEPMEEIDELPDDDAVSSIEDELDLD
ncbi:MAG: hypothetical protein ACLFOY_05650 [Desulfatibacillaceae bacterium]